ncbi:T9SS type A sorting domain-containing protein [Flexithrix dorotheae]|uniref:T9SS type A sorting domain-containing protein n=1 Tax=Flexithrix dorotheae TaxID=70993 RepID=UPI00035F942D|nr:T9SS type A sorting domain-containing protein [Flexithrix dorotheae]
MKKRILSRIIISLSLFCGVAFNLFGQFTSSQTGDWEDCETWGFGGGCTSTIGVTFPDSLDNVTISAGHTVTINTHYSTKPKDYGVSTNVNGNNSNTYLHTGNITVNGSLTTDNLAAMITGTVIVSGDLNIDGDFFTTGILNIESSATNFSVSDDFILSGSSETNIDMDAETADDIYLDGPNSLLCGSDTLDLQNGNSSKIQEFNGADRDNQICSTIVITGCDICPFSGSGIFVLPIELLYFKGFKNKDNIEIEWATTQEINNDYFTIERSFDGKNWETLNMVAGKGNSHELVKYNVIDANPGSPLNYYRLKHTDLDGGTFFSEIICVHFNQSILSTLLVYPNPTNGEINLTGLPSAENVLSIQLTKLSGEVVFATNPNQLSGSIFKLDLNNFNLRKGIYLINIITKQEILKEKIIYE